MQLIWKQPDNTLAVTILSDEVLVDGFDVSDYAGHLVTIGVVPVSWQLIGVDIPWPESSWKQETYKWDGTQIIVDIAKAQTEVAERIEIQFKTALTEPVSSSALGAPHTYQADESARNFLNNLVTFGTGGRFACVDAVGVVERRQHTAEQLLQVGSDMRAAIETKFDHYESLLEQTAAATTESQLLNIHW